jgi:hypothetical protein
LNRQVERARGLLARSGAWLDRGEAGYPLRLKPDRRTRPVLTVDEAGFRALIGDPGLKPRDAGGWTARPSARTGPPAEVGRPGLVEGVRSLAGPDGAVASRRANLGQSPIAWLAARRDAAGAPLLTAAQAAAGARLTLDAERALAGPSMTMRWDALPRSGAGGLSRVEPTDPALAAGRRVARALSAVPPAHRALLDWICVRGSALAVAEQGLGLRRRTGKRALREALQALADHYGRG